MNGYEALRSSAAWFDLPLRGRIRLTGEDRVRLVHAMCTNHIEQLQPGQGCTAFFLNAQGRILADALIFNLGDALLIDTEPEARERLFQHLDEYIIADDAVPQDVSASLAAVGIAGPGSAAVLAARGFQPATQDFAIELQPNGYRIANVSLTGQPGGFIVYLPAGELADFAASLNIPQADDEAVRTVRIENGKPRFGEEITDRYLVQETGLMNLVSFSKGCYLGQEIVERVRSRGQVHRHLKRVDIHSAAPPPPAGAKLTLDGKESGEIASAVHSPASGNCVGFAYVRTAAATPGTQLALDGVAVQVL